MFKSGLVPRPMAMFGLVGGPLCFASGIAVLFGLYSQTSGINPIATIPEIIWEATLGIYLIVKGFKPSPITAGYDAQRAKLDTELSSSSRSYGATAN